MEICGIGGDIFNDGVFWGGWNNFVCVDYWEYGGY